MSYNEWDVIRAIENCQFDEFKNTVKSGALDVNNKYEEMGCTALHHVLVNRTLDVTQKIEWIKLLASLGADLNMKYGTTPQNHVSPLFLAMQREDTEIIKCLVEQGAHLHEKVNDGGDTLLHAAATFGKIESIQCLVSLGIDVNAKNNNGWTPIYYAADQGKIESIQCLVKLGADVNARSNDGFTPIFMAVSGNKVQSLKCLKALGADLNAKANDGRTALSLGIGLGDVPEAVEWLKINDPIAAVEAEAQAQAKQRKIEQEARKAQIKKTQKKVAIAAVIAAICIAAGFMVFNSPKKSVTIPESPVSANQQSSPTSSDNSRQSQNTFQATHKVVTNDGSNLRLRDAPGFNSSQIGSLGYGSSVRVLDTGASAVDSDGNRGNWTHVATPDGKTGWCFGAYLHLLPR